MDINRGTCRLILKLCDYCSHLLNRFLKYISIGEEGGGGGGVTVTQSVECTTPGQEIVGLTCIHCGVRSRSHFRFLSMSVSCDPLRQKSWSLRSISVWQYVKMSDVSLWARPRDRLVPEEDVKKPRKRN